MSPRLLAPAASTECDAARSAFCRRSVERVRRDSRGLGVRRALGGGTTTPGDDAEETPVHEAMLQRLRLAAITDDVRQASVLRAHVPARCPPCRDAAAAVARADFARRKRSQLQRRELERDVDARLYAQDSLSLIGDIHKGLLLPCAPPGVIWDAMKSKQRILMESREERP